jgi:hypothetical protein
MNSFLEATIRLTHKVCPSLYDRMDIAIRARVKYRQLKRNKPVDPQQVYSGGPLVSKHKQKQDIKRWERNLKRYAKMYEKARFPYIDPPANEIFDL